MPYFTVFFTNFGYGPLQSFECFQDALEFGRKRGFEFSVTKHDRAEARMVFAWSPISGGRMLVGGTR